MPDTSTWTQPSLVLTSHQADDIDDIDNHLDDCICDDCIDNVILDWVENKRAS